MIATVHLIDNNLLMEFYFQGKNDPASLARKYLQAGLYRRAGAPIVTQHVGEDAAEEIFDLSNNPSREDERAERYGSHRSLSVGDIVSVNGIDYLCAIRCWVQL